MNTPIRTTLAVVLSLSATSSLALAQASAPRLAMATSYAATSTSNYDAAAVRARIAHADELALRGKITAASREYIAVAKMQRAQNVLPTEAMWKLAELNHSTERYPARTADILIALALDAERFGEPQIQAKALLEAAIQYKNADNPVKARECVDRLEQLVASPHVSDEFRQEVQRRIIRK